MRMRFINDLGSKNLKGLVLSLAVPSMLSQLVSVFYSIVDRMYIGNIDGIGDMCLAGVGVVSPIVTMITSFAFLVGIGSSPLLSRSLGEKREDKAFDIVANAFLLILIIALSVIGVSYMLKDWMLYTFGASDNIYQYANDYFSIYLFGIIFSLIGTAMNQLIICQGFGKQGMLSVMLGAVINIVLDPIFIFILGMGVKGAAIATVISQCISCLYVLRFLFSNDAYIRITFKGYSLKLMINILKMGFTCFIIIMFDNFMLIGLNTVLTKYGGAGYGDMLLTCNTILQSFMLIITMPLGGLTTGTQTVLGYALGAKDYWRIRDAQKLIFKLALIFTGIMFIVANILSRYFVMIFTSTPEYIEMTIRIIRLSTLGIIPLGIQYEIVDGFTGLGKVKVSLFLSALRKVVYFICIFVLPLYIPIRYVFIAETISDTIPVVVSVIIYIIVIRKLQNECN